MSPWRRHRVERKLRHFIFEQLLDELHDGGDPLTTEAIDSLGREQLVDYIEQEFGVTVGNEEMAAGHFESIPALAAFVDSKRAAAL